MSQAVILPISLRERLTALAVRTRRLHAVRGAGVVVQFLALVAAAALAADYFFDLPALVRRAIFVVWAGAGAALLCRRLIWPVLRRLDLLSLAAAVEKAHPSLDESLSTAVELAANADDRHGAPAFVDYVVQETERQSGALDFHSAIPSQDAINMAVTAGAALLLLLSPAAVWPAEYRDLMHRFLLPWHDQPTYVFTVSPGDVAAARGSSVTIDVSVRPRSSRVRLPATATLVVADAQGGESLQRMHVERPDAFSAPLTVKADGRYRIEVRASAGDAPVASETYGIMAVTPVELLPDSPSITVTPPDYARRTRDEETRTGLVDLTALQGSVVRFRLGFNRPAVAARMEWAGSDSKTHEFPFWLAEDSLSAELTLPVMATANYRFILEAEHGITTQLDGGLLTVKPDMPPAVLNFSSHEELKAVTPYDHVPLECSLVDDVGVAKADLLYRVNDGKPAREPISLKGAGRLEASGELAFALEGKVKDGDTISYRLRVEDNLPKEMKGPHVVYSPADRWLTLKIVQQPGPMREQEITARREEIDRRIDTLRQALLQEMRGLYKLKLESRVDPVLSPEQREALTNLQAANKSTENGFRALAQEAAASPALQQLAEKARDIAEREMQQSEAALRGAGTTRLPATERDGHFKEADDRLNDAVTKLENLKKLNEQIARDRADRLRLENLAEKQQQLAEKAADLAKRDAGDPAVAEKAEQLRREQAETAEELRRLSEQSPQLQKSLEQARANRAELAAERARQLAEAERALAKAKADAETERKAGELAELAKQQRELAKEALRLAEDTRQAARGAGVPPLRTDDAARAADALTDGDAKEATRLQDSLARNLDRLADGLDRAREQSRDPRLQARQLARLQDDLRQRVQNEMHRKDAERPLAERLSDLVREQEAIRKSAEGLSLPPDDDASRTSRSKAVEKSEQAAEALRRSESEETARKALGPMEETRRALEKLAAGLAPLPQRQQLALADVARVRAEQENIARQVDQVARDFKDGEGDQVRDLAKSKLSDSAKRQAELLKNLQKVDAATREPRRTATALSLGRALSDLQKGLPEDARASQIEAQRQLQRLEDAIAEKKPSDEAVVDLARRQNELAAEIARDDKSAREKVDVRVKQQDLTNQVLALSAPEAPQRRAETERATRAVLEQVTADPTSASARAAGQKAAGTLDELSKQMNGGESAAARADRLARRQAQIATDAEKLLGDKPDKTGPPESQDEIIREEEQLRGGVEGRSAKRNAERAFETIQKATDPKDRLQAQQQAAKWLRELADRIAARQDDSKPGDADSDPRAGGPNASSPRGAPNQQQSDQARKLASQERKLRDAVRKAEHDAANDQAAPGNDKLGELAKAQTELARRSSELSRQLTSDHGEQSSLARTSEKASDSARQAAAKLQNGEVPAAQESGKQAAEQQRHLTEELAQTPRNERENSANDTLSKSRELSRQQEELNRRLAELAKDSDAKHTRQQARQKELSQQTEELAGELDQLKKDLASNPQAAESAERAARSVRSARGQMDKSAKENASQANHSQEDAARSLDRAAREAEHAASARAKTAEGQDEKASSMAGESVNQARDQMEQAQGQLQKSSVGQAHDSMTDAARRLREAIGQLTQSARPGAAGQPDSAAASGGPGPAAAGRPDASLFGPGAAKYAGKTWGELPGELRTKIVQDMKIRYGEDYARMIKLYFEQVADTKRDGK